MKTLPLLLIAVSVLTAAPSQAEPPPSPHPAELTVPGDVLVYRIVGALLVGTTRSGKIATYDISDRAQPKRRTELDVGSPVAELRLADGIVLAIGADKVVRAYVFGEDGTATLLNWGQTAAVTAVRRSKTLGKVVESQRGSLLIELTDANAVTPGDSLLVRSRGTEARINPFTGEEEEVASNAPTAVVEVLRVEGTRAVAELGRGDVARPGDAVELNDQHREVSRAFPVRGAYTQWARATLRPMANVGTIDIASVSDLAWGYYGSWFHVQARLAPFALSVPVGVDVFNAHAIFAYSSDYAELGFGFGYFREKVGAYSAYDCGTGSTAEAAPDVAQPGRSTQATTCTKSGPAFVQHLRLGAVDGLNLRFTNTTVISDGFRLGYFDGSLDIPLTRTLNLYAMGGGSTAVGIGEFGTRTYLRGVGGAATLILTTGLGYTSLRTSEIYGAQSQGISGTSYSSYVGGQSTVSGPHFSVGVEYRY